MGLTCVAAKAELVGHASCKKAICLGPLALCSERLALEQGKSSP